MSPPNNSTSKIQKIPLNGTPRASWRIYSKPRHRRTSTNQYVNQFKSWWEENISFYVDVTNAGIGATDSYIGVHRAQRDALEAKPDIIVIEFINDADDEFYESCMDSLVRMCLEQDNNPAVMILEPSTELGGTSPQAAHLKVAQAYNIPMISYHDAVMPEMLATSHGLTFHLTTFTLMMTDTL